MQHVHSSMSDAPNREPVITPGHGPDGRTTVNNVAGSPFPERTVVKVLWIEGISLQADIWALCTGLP